MKKVKLLIGKDQEQYYTKAAHELGMKVVKSYDRQPDRLNIYVNIFGDSVNEICRLCVMAGYFQGSDLKDSLNH